MTILLAVVAGGALGYVFERGDFCFHSTWRSLLATPTGYDLFRAYILLLLICTPLVQLMIALDVINPYVAPLTWRATILGGLIFGIGMVVASTCISGMFYKLGRGMLGMFVAIPAWIVGDLLVYRGPLSSLRDNLNEDPISVVAADGSTEVATVTSAFGLIGVAFLIVAWVAGVRYLSRAHAADSGLTPRPVRGGSLLGWLPLGVAAALALSGAWLLVRLHGFDYTFGTSGVPSQLWGRLTGDDNKSLWIPLALVSLIGGAWIAARLSGTLWVRGESPTRLAQLAGGGLLMGIGSGIAGGCNLGHGMVGVPLLSLGSISATAAIVAGVAIADRVVKVARSAR